MVIQHLRYLTALAREGHFARAAAACGVSQPTLSAGIRRLETELGVLIVRRERRYAGLSAEGERILGWAQQIVADCDALRQDVTSMRGGLAGRLRIGAIPTSLSSLSLVTTPITARHPNVRVLIQSLNSRQIERGLHDFELDLGMTYLDSEPLGTVRTVPLYRERYVLLTAADGPFAGRAEVTWAEAATVPLCLLSADMQNRRIVDGLFREAGAEPRPRIETNSITTLYAQAVDGPLSSVMAHPWLRLFSVPEGLRALPLVEPERTHRVGIVALARETEPLLVRAVLEEIATLELQDRLDAVLGPGRG